MMRGRMPDGARRFPGVPYRPVAITSSQVIANLASGDGGGIYNFGGSTVSLTSAEVAGHLPGNCARRTRYRAEPGALAQLASQRVRPGRPLA